MFGNWMTLGLNWTMLAIESQHVIALRMAKLSLGGAAASREASRMITEKFIAFDQLAAHVAKGGSAHSAVKKYRRKVRSNRRRLAR
jgi:hypothetical protein